MAVNLPTLAEQVGVSARQLDVWTRAGLIRPEHPHPGSGNPRWFTDKEAGRVLVIATLVHIGFSPRAARDVVELGRYDDAGTFHAHLHARSVHVTVEVQP